MNITAQGISGDGSIVVGTSWGTGIIEEAFRWTAEAGLCRLDGLYGEGIRSSAEAVSANGLIVVGHRIYEGFPYGDCFRWTESEVIGFDAHTANATSSDGSVVVGGLDNHDTALFEAYRWTQETGLTLLGTCLPNFHSRALAVSGNGSVVVGYVQNNSGFDEQKAFIWDQKHGMRLLQDVLEDDFGLDLSGWKLTEPWASWKATGISEDGLTVVGVALNPQGQREAWRAVLVLGEAIYVDADAAGANNGSSWENAYNCLQDALADANSPDKAVEIRVAEGVYKPDHGAAQTPGDMEATFRLINGVKVRGDDAQNLSFSRSPKIYAHFKKSGKSMNGYGSSLASLSIASSSFLSSSSMFSSVICFSASASYSAAVLTTTSSSVSVSLDLSHPLM
jgi:hypothetical protein